MNQTTPIGLMFSTSGPYAALGRTALDGALMAIDEVNERSAGRLTAIHADPEGVPALYEQLVGELVRRDGVKHIIGGITSWSRKDMIPALERHGALLWYPCPYEGFECNDHVVYLGACPNQHLVRLIEHVVTKGVRTAFLVGSDYVWGWETLRVARDLLEAQGVEVVGEHFQPLGETDCTSLVAELEAGAPDLVVNSLIGPSNYAFMQAIAAGFAGGGRPLVASANQTEADLDRLGPAGEGLLAIGAWFETVQDRATVEFRERIVARFGSGYRASCFFATAYSAVHLLAQCLGEAGHDAPHAVFSALAGTPRETVLGRIEVNRITRHTSLVPRLAVAEKGAFRILSDGAQAVQPDPYLTHLSAREGVGVQGSRPILKVVS